MKNTGINLISLFTGLILLILSCDDFFEKNISDKSIKVVCPVDGAQISGKHLSLVWNEEEGAKEYHVVIVSPSFQNAQTYVCDTTVTAYKIELTLSKGDYQWSIKAKNSGYESLTSYFSFQIKNDEE